MEEAYNDFENDDEEVYNDNFDFEEPKVIDKRLEKKESIINDEKYKTSLIPIEEEDDINDSIKKAELKSLNKNTSPVKNSQFNNLIPENLENKKGSSKKFENDTDKLIFDDIERKVMRNNNEVLLNPSPPSILSKV